VKDQLKEHVEEMNNGCEEDKREVAFQGKIVEPGRNLQLED
jgi:hypothetical protein